MRVLGASALHPVPDTVGLSLAAATDMAGAARKTTSSGLLAFSPPKVIMPPEGRRTSGGKHGERAQQTPSPDSSTPNTDPTYGQPSTLVGADESLAAELRRLGHPGHTAKSHSRLRRPTFRGEELVSVSVAGVAQLVEQAPCKR